MDEYDALVVPGGVINADHLRMEEKARQWVQKFLKEDKPVAVICHGPWLLVSADCVRDRRLTSYFTLQDDIRNAGGIWLDESVVVDNNLITSRTPDDLPAFNDALTSALAK
jgi:protease I